MKIEHVVEGTIEPVCPKVRTRGAVDELARDPRALSTPLGHNSRPKIFV